MLSFLQEARPARQVDSLPVCATMSHADSGPRAVVRSDGNPQAAAGAPAQRALQAVEWRLPLGQHALPLFQVLLEYRALGCAWPGQSSVLGEGAALVLRGSRGLKNVHAEKSTLSYAQLVSVSVSLRALSLGQGSGKSSVTAVSEQGISRGSSTAAHWPGRPAPRVGSSMLPPGLGGPGPPPPGASLCEKQGQERRARSHGD